ncbi:hypothetical protein [Frankia sp. Cr1]|uniref:hypothetical protein n=1 Tax=Frankia sp. Cr1 TaxID=3073931 RepID=UPI002AD4CFF0|nr:hypothetical protein [Frankia sp. Cr1]
MNQGLVLPDEQFAKAVVYMRALRRAVIAFWYATIEDVEAALIEAAQACFAVNILDEAVFAHALGDPYRQIRAKDRLGQVVTGLELIRNCETHAHVGFDGLLVERRVLGVPMHGGTIPRVVPSWAEYADLPAAYVELDQSATAHQKRARGEAQHGYRMAVAGRGVLETLLDAMTFFQQIDPRLVTTDGPVLQYAYVELLPDRDPAAGEAEHVVLTRPMGLDTEVLLLSLATRNTERRSAQWPAADGYFTAKVKAAKSTVPGATHREIRYALRDKGKVIGYAGVSPDGPSGRGRGGAVVGAPGWQSRGAAGRKGADRGSDRRSRPHVAAVLGLAVPRDSARAPCSVNASYSPTILTLYAAVNVRRVVWPSLGPDSFLPFPLSPSGPPDDTSFMVNVTRS